MNPESFEFISARNKKILLEIWKAFNSIKQELFEFGILVFELDERDYCFYIKLDVTKIDKNSLAIQHNINGFYVACSPFNIQFTPELFLLNDTSIMHESTKYIYSLFPVKSFLKKIFKIIGIKLFDRYKNIFNLNKINKNIYMIIKNIKKHKNIKEFKINLENLHEYKIMIDKYIQWKKNNEIDIQIYENELDQLIDIRNMSEQKNRIMNMLSDLNFEMNDTKIDNCLLYTLKETIEELTTYAMMCESTMKLREIKTFLDEKKIEIFHINISNNLLEEIFIKEIINFEKYLFPETFNLETIPSEITKNVDIYNKKYIQLSKEIQDYLNHAYEFRTLEKKIDECLIFINHKK